MNVSKFSPCNIAINIGLMAAALVAACSRTSASDATSSSAPSARPSAVPDLWAQARSSTSADSPRPQIQAPSTPLRAAKLSDLSIAIAEKVRLTGDPAVTHADACPGIDHAIRREAQGAFLREGFRVLVGPTDVADVSVHLEAELIMGRDKDVVTLIAERRGEIVEQITVEVTDPDCLGFAKTAAAAIVRQVLASTKLAAQFGIPLDTLGAADAGTIGVPAVSAPAKSAARSTP